VKHSTPKKNDESGLNAIDKEMEEDMRAEFDEESEKKPVVEKNNKKTKKKAAPKKKADDSMSMDSDIRVGNGQQSAAPINDEEMEEDEALARELGGN
jgi:hypothetical protein